MSTEFQRVESSQKNYRLIDQNAFGHFYRILYPETGWNHKISYPSFRGTELKLV